MIHKRITQVNGKSAMCVTFTLPDGVWADSVHLVGDFNQWSRRAHPLRHNQQGEWHLSMDLELNRQYHFRYLLNGRDWAIDHQADGYDADANGMTRAVINTAFDLPAAG